MVQHYVIFKLQSTVVSKAVKSLGQHFWGFPTFRLYSIPETEAFN